MMEDYSMKTGSKYFNSEAFAELLQQAIGHDTQASFARKAEISTPYLSKYINKRFKNAPAPMTLKRIADASSGSISYNDLMSVCGYASNDHVTTDNINIFLAAIIDCLDHKNIKWNMHNDYPINFPDFFGSYRLFELSGIGSWWFFYNPCISENYFYTLLGYLTTLDQWYDDQKYTFIFGGITGDQDDVHYPSTINFCNISVLRGDVYTGKLYYEKIISRLTEPLGDLTLMT